MSASEEKEVLRLVYLLDDLVVDTALKDASVVNNSGVTGQRKWLLKHGWNEKNLNMAIEELMEPEK